jgi:hypothetical protein
MGTVEHLNSRPEARELLPNALRLATDEHSNSELREQTYEALNIWPALTNIRTTGGTNACPGADVPRDDVPKDGAGPWNAGFLRQKQEVLCGLVWIVARHEATG